MRTHTHLFGSTLLSSCIAHAVPSLARRDSQGRPGWRRVGVDVAFYGSDPQHELLPREGAKKEGYQTLAWTYSFEHDDDTVFFAYHYPYTYTYQREVISALAAHPYASRFVQRGVLCKTIGGAWGGSMQPIPLTCRQP